MNSQLCDIQFRKDTWGISFNLDKLSKSGWPSSNIKLPKGPRDNYTLENWSARTHSTLMLPITYIPRLLRTTKVERISDIFRLLYNYEVRDIPLAWEDKNTTVWWTSDTSSFELEDLQIVYYLGSITHKKDSGGFMNMRASPFFKSTWVSQIGKLIELTSSSDYNNLQVNNGSWMSGIISFPNLVSDGLVVLDCYAEGLKDINSEYSTISHVTDDDHPWARYAIMIAGYIEKSTPPGTFSEHFMSLLEELTRPDHPRSRFRPSDVAYLVKKLNKTFKVGDRMEPEVIGNESIFLFPTSIDRR